MIRAESEDLCVGCETCFHCGRQKPIVQLKMYCDKCGDDIEMSYKIDGKDICENCLEDVLEITWLEDLDVQDYV